MKRQDFTFELPEALIAKYPLSNRCDSRLLVFNSETKAMQHHQFHDLTAHLKPGDLLVMNNTKVVKARLFGVKDTGGQVELLIERVQSANTFLTHIRASKSPKPGTVIYLNDSWTITVLEKRESLYYCQSNISITKIMEDIGHVPLPPYINRDDESSDLNRYQTVYAKHDGSVAAPTAGLHFDEPMLKKLEAMGVNIAYVTLHVGAGTFQPVRVESIFDHKMHKERFEVTQAVVDAIADTKKNGGRVIAVGTTAIRSLESAAKDGELSAKCEDTDIFIYPGFRFKVCDGLITNFHLPESTLLMLVSAFIGYDETMALYQEAILQQYRFYSYGDASLLI